jgi:hypothetical protein
MVLQLHFAQDGRVQEVHAVKSSGSASLDQQTIAFISHNWQCPRLANHVAQQVIAFHPPAMNYQAGELREGDAGAETWIQWR